MKTITKIMLKEEPETEPDLSYLESVIEDGKVVSSCRLSNEDVEKYGIEQVEAWAKQDTDRLMSYGSQWYMVYMYAEAEVVVNGCIQTVHSGGLGNVESDFDVDRFEEINREELGQLKGQLMALGFSEKAINEAPVLEMGAPECTAEKFAELMEA